MVSILDREMYSEAEAARLLRLPQSTLHYWLEGGDRRGRAYKPVIRVESRGGRSVTWAEFVEAGLLREYRRTHGVPMPELRARMSAGRWATRTLSARPRERRSVFDQVEVIMCRWRDIERCLTEPAPFIYGATRTRLRPIPPT